MDIGKRTYRFLLLFFVLCSLVGCHFFGPKDQTKPSGIVHSDQITALIQNKAKVPNNNIHKVTFVSVPFSGHFDILMKSALQLAKNPKLKVNVVITGWENIKVPEESLTKLSKAGVHTTILNDKPLASPAPMSFTFPRVVHLVDKTTASIQRDTDVIIYDFFAMEGFFAGKRLGIPAICSIPAIPGPFNPENADFQQGIKDNEKYITQLEEKFDTPIKKKLEMVSDAFLLPSESENLVWSWPNFVKASDFQANRNLKNLTFVRPEKDQDVPQFDIKAKDGQKIVYVSLGTVVTKNLWDNVPEVRSFVQRILNQLVKDFGNKKEYHVIVSTGRTPHEVIQHPPSNFQVFERVPQVAVLKKADVFVTHAGGNSVNEAIDSEVPMVAIPFFGDQHLCAWDIEKLKIGRSFLHTIENREKAINTKAGVFERASLREMQRLTDAIKDVLRDSSYRSNLKRVKQDQPQSISQALGQLFLFKWQEGDMIYGINRDRKAWGELTGLQDYFRIGDVRPFTQLFGDRTNPNELPKIIDQYNDVLRSPDYERESITKKFPKYREYLRGFNQFLKKHPEYIQPLGHYPKTLDSKAELETVWNMCLGGLDYFIHNKKCTFHFVLKDYDSRINKATTEELMWVKKRWEQGDTTVKEHVRFYLFQNGVVRLVDPVEYNWFVYPIKKGGKNESCKCSDKATCNQRNCCASDSRHATKCVCTQ